MRLLHVPESGALSVMKTLRAYTGLDLRGAKRLIERTRAGERPDVPVLARMSVRECVNELLEQGCSISTDFDPEPPSRDQVAEVNEEALFCDGLDGALIGYVERFGQAPLALYDREKVIQILMEDMECDECSDPGCEHVWEMAEEHFGFNVLGAWVGENTPAFATLLRHED